MAARLLLLFIVIPVVELWLLIKVGSMIGVVWTLALVLLTALIGSQLVRRQGLSVMQRIQAAQARGEAPALPVLNGAALLLAGLMLLTPGFVSDTLGFLLLVPKLRERIARGLLSRVVIMTPGGMGGAGRGGPFGQNDSSIEGEYKRKSESERKADNERISRDD